jgi:hypothetical protein
VNTQHRTLIGGLPVPAGVNWGFGWGGREADFAFQKGSCRLLIFSPADI